VVIYQEFYRKDLQLIRIDLQKRKLFCLTEVSKLTAELLFGNN